MGYWLDHVIPYYDGEIGVEERDSLLDIIQNKVNIDSDEILENVRLLTLRNCLEDSGERMVNPEKREHLDR